MADLGLKQASDPASGVMEILGVGVCFALYGASVGSPPLQQAVGRLLLSVSGFKYGTESARLTSRCRSRRLWSSSLKILVKPAVLYRSPAHAS